MFILGRKFATLQHAFMSLIFLRNDSGNIDLRESIRYARRREAVNYEQSSDWKQQGWQGGPWKIIFILSWSLLRRRRLLVLSRLIELNWYFTASYMAKISYLLILLIVLLVLLMILLPLGSRSVTTWIGLLDYWGWCWAWILPIALKILYIETKTFTNSNFTFL